MTAINLTAINTSTAYIKSKPQETLGSREIYRFILQDSESQEVLNSAVKAITCLLTDNNHLSFVSKPTKDETLQQKIKSCQYLIINGDALCLSNKPKAPKDIDPICQDMFFSEALIDKPVQCSKGRSFEETYIRAWVELRGNVCPCSNHEIGSIEVDSYVLERIRSILTTHRLIQDVTDDKMIQDARLKSLEAQVKPNRVGEIAGGSIKIITKSQALVAFTTACAPKACAFHTFGKQIPIVSVIFGCILAAYRGYKGYRTNNKVEYAKAVAELASGIAACFPIYGTAGSIGVDIAMAGHDIYEITNNKVNLKIDLKTAHEVLGLNSNEKLSQEQINQAYEQVDKSFREKSKVCHPDPVVENVPQKYSKEELNDLQKVLKTCKDLLCDHYAKNKTNKETEKTK